MTTSARVQQIPFDFGKGNFIRDLITTHGGGGYPPADAMAPGDVASYTWVTHLLQTSWFDALASYHPTAVGVCPTAVGVCSRIPRRPVGESATNRNRNIAGLYAMFQVVKGVFTEREPVLRQAFSALGPDPDDESRDVTTAVGIGNVAGTSVVATPQLALVTPQTYHHPDRFTLPAPGHLDHTDRKAYRQAVDEVLAASAGLDDERKMKAEFFEHTPLSVTLSPRAAAMAHDLDLDGWAQLFLVCSTARFDSLIAAWHHKRAFDAVRPFGAVRHFAAGSGQREPGTVPAADLQLTWATWSDFETDCAASRVWAGARFTQTSQASPGLRHPVRRPRPHLRPPTHHRQRRQLTPPPTSHDCLPPLGTRKITMTTSRRTLLPGSPGGRRSLLIRGASALVGEKKARDRRRHVDARHQRLEERRIEPPGIRERPHTQRATPGGLHRLGAAELGVRGERPRGRAAAPPGPRRPPRLRGHEVPGTFAARHFVTPQAARTRALILKDPSRSRVARPDHVDHTARPVRSGTSTAGVPVGLHEPVLGHLAGRPELQRLRRPARHFNRTVDPSSSVSSRRPDPRAAQRHVEGSVKG
ncbi:hypothetical protein O7599_33015 [Streptomyces sp. WMMC500]|uniref:DUF6851 domain-containing protein n=1 Tax=Streptomyces sp. WMMC500 TaxID=3015154 RepID=UPI00248CC6BE|nr:hypothetical protein [Streptomyces sp. WMMC500]WBB60289.1 hypothetical protein O7599_33015 [Streptomyces sp. WMMC500]